MYVEQKSNNGANIREKPARNDRPWIMERPEKYGSNKGRLPKWSCCGGS
jgi:hypothetical protein